MSIGFRKAFFGFNCDDVVSYIEKSHKEFSEKEKNLNEKIEGLDKTLDDLKIEIESVKSAKESAEAELMKYNSKYEEIERMSRNIGKLYLVAQSNAQAIIKNSDDARKAASDEVETNLSAISTAHESLDELKARINSTASDFINRVNGLMTSLDKTRDIIDKSRKSSDDHEKEFQELYAEISK